MLNKPKKSEIEKDEDVLVPADSFKISVDEKATALAGGKRAPLDRTIPAETPVSLVYNGLSHVVMMLTPTDLEAFALGFSLTEEIIGSADELLSAKLQYTEKGIILSAEIPEARYQDLLHRRRNLVGQTGCGLCGFVELENITLPLNSIEKPPQISEETAQQALSELPKWQPLNADTGAVHAAAFADASGKIIAASEDVGRHNALDKLIGQLAAQQIDVTSGFVVLSSRCSYELVQKALAAGIPALVTISAPTELAVNMARDHDLTLIALAREDSMLCFNDPFEVF